MGRKETTILITILVNLGLIGLKFLLAGISGSLSLRASGWHSFSDVFVSGLVLAGLVLAGRSRARAEGVSRIEHVVSLLVALFILYVGFDIFQEALEGGEPELRNVFWVALAAVLTIALSYFMARYKTYVGRVTGSPALVADGYHSLIDMYSSIVVVAGLFGYAIGFRNLDKITAMVVVFFIAFGGYEIARDAVAGLTGKGHVEHPGRPGHIEHPLLAEPRRLLRRALPFLAFALIAMYLLSGVYVVEPGKVAIVQRFGRLAEASVQPGLHYRLPWPVDKVRQVPVAAVQRADAPRSLMLTGDENLINVAATVHYRVREPTAFAFNIDEPAELVSVAAEAALRQTVALRPVDALLTSDKWAIQEEAQRLLQARLDTARAGLEVVAVQLIEASPPEEVAGAFLDVASASEDRVTYTNEAQAYRNEIVPKARGEAEKQVSDAEAYKAEKINNASGEAGRFASRLAEYKNAPAATRARLYLEAIERVLPGVQKFLLSSEVGNGNLDLWFSRGGAPPMLPAPENPGPQAPPFQPEPSQPPQPLEPQTESPSP